MKLLLAIDINDQSRELVAEAITWAKRLGAVLDLIYVDDLHLVQEPELRTLLDRERQKIHDAQRGRLEQLLERVPPEVRGEALYRAGGGYRTRSWARLPSAWSACPPYPS